ncbi:DNA-directed RNA polymerase subunit alpha [Campylobacter pinnipediorum]|uniref:DNA-directed RNA polymerase subunit alpha n=1 Tax=Campylobacter pinnipediorum subsp. pinnipediorum TaxID=1660067 RepID=A0AAX0L9A0_9BACT|nr:DNA-directed RNA polymerase subunit alpha [Campylobacter pinnipediorum]AQW80586.1 DNA-directed RNA polymerase, alpha subunit [Campylobacter pinnipediorum subsp. pinnipediorum]AQW82254.1 DNA-directed RNA polymerase, alpha subunit [Campylobacter pinnipediorum subsp. pinnipediorum]AQW83931.1 DNA-directed RNA polymerase, alpha subunit [Campylobacter pinnipediorum subsp. pinnipediorum]OPA74912.1 DNA-directed RNA polymerase subunit alpha [Campylobacter pinnipediorum subsp. pinnipediorum]OPA75059.
MRKITTSAYMPTEIKVESISENMAKIIAYPFEAGYAVTLAHPLRRLLYTSTVGFAPTGIKIKGVTHEFDSMRGMLEDVALFIINLKNLRFKLKNDSQREVIEYNFKGHKEIIGADLNNDLVEIVNPSEYLATLNEDAELSFQLIVQKGIGYVSSEDLRSSVDEDYIALDAFFTPVKKAIYDIENVLVEDTPDFEKIIFTITTDGQVKPIEAFKNSLEAMYQQMSVFKGILNIDLDTPVVSSNANSEYSKLLSSVEELNLSARSFNCIDKADIKYIGELALMDEAELKELKNLGKKSLDEIKAIMEEIGYPVGATLPRDAKEYLKKKIAELKTQTNAKE